MTKHTRFPRELPEPQRDLVAALLRAQAALGWRQAAPESRAATTTSAGDAEVRAARHKA